MQAPGIPRGSRNLGKARTPQSPRGKPEGRCPNGQFSFLAVFQSSGALATAVPAVLSRIACRQLGSEGLTNYQMERESIIVRLLSMNSGAL